jgi:hypothetical protein
MQFTIYATINIIRYIVCNTVGNGVGNIVSKIVLNMVCKIVDNMDQGKVTLYGCLRR